MNYHKKIYSAIVRLLEANDYTREQLISKTEAALGSQNKRSVTEIGTPSLLRAKIGEVINEMAEGGLITSTGSKLSLVWSRPVILRIERCEKAILDVLRKSPSNKTEIRNALEEKFGTNRTATVKDDNILHTFIGQILKRLLNLGIITLKDSKYYIAPEKEARLDDIGEILTLKGDFLSRLHSRGGEFFEHYFMTLLGKYMAKNGKTVTENYTTGGSADGGIDGIIKTIDSLGFRETIMVQTKNRLEVTNETTVRSFYGAVCAAQGSRGIFATSSDFHESAQKFLSGIDNCVGINGNMLFKMA